MLNVRGLTTANGLSPYTHANLCTFVPFAPCTLYFALNWFCVIVLLQWVASYDGPCAFLAAVHFVLLLTVSTAVLLYCGEKTFSLCN